MGHDATKVLLGNVRSSDKDLTCESGDPLTFLAGLAVRKNSAGALSLSSADGSLIGVSAGRSLSGEIGKTSVVRDGNEVPLRLTDEGVLAAKTVAQLVFTARAKGVAGNSIRVRLVVGGTAGAEVVTVAGLDISVQIESTVSTATQVKAALDASPAAMLLISVATTGTASNAQTAFAYTNLLGGVDSYGFPVVGAPVRVSNSTGKAVSSSGTLTGATYLRVGLTGVGEDGSEVPGVAVIDMGGGL